MSEPMYTEPFDRENILYRFVPSEEAKQVWIGGVADEYVAVKEPKGWIYARRGTRWSHFQICASSTGVMLWHLLTQQRSNSE